MDGERKGVKTGKASKHLHNSIRRTETGTRRGAGGPGGTGGTGGRVNEAKKMRVLLILQPAPWSIFVWSRERERERERKKPAKKLIVRGQIYFANYIGR